jgi:hypothetical protein
MEGQDSRQSGDLEESLWESPTKSGAPSTQPNMGKPRPQEQQDRDARLREELQSVREVNEALESVIRGLCKAKDNMKVGRLSGSTKTAHVEG